MGLTMKDQNSSKLQNNGWELHCRSVGPYVNEESEGVVIYGTSLNFLNQISELDSYKTNHQIMLNGLSNNVTYYYQIFSTDTCGNSSVSSMRSFLLKERPLILTGLRKNNGLLSLWGELVF
jgi:hypothetical protein